MKTKLVAVMILSGVLLGGCATRKINAVPLQEERLSIGDIVEQSVQDSDLSALPNNDELPEAETLPEEIPPVDSTAAVLEENPLPPDENGSVNVEGPEISEPDPAPLPPAPELPEIWSHDFPKLDLSGWQYILANPDNAVGDYIPPLAEIEGQQADYRVIEPLQEMIAACRAAGNRVYLYSAYRSYQTQVNLFERKVSQVGSEAKAATIVARPGTSEHQTGLAFDITDQFYSMLTYDLEYTATYRWLKEHCAEYGFIVRYEKNKVDITKIIYEPWHFRYVGVEAAAYIMEHGICYEEFLALYDGIFPTELIGAETLNPELLE